MASIAIGDIKIIKNCHILNNKLFLILITLQAKTAINKPPIGSSKFVEISAKKSKIFHLLNILIVFNKLKDKLQNVLPIITKVPIISTDLFLLILNLSISKNTNGSAKDMLEDKAAKNNNIKNAKLNNEPKGILANITGSEINIKPGPEDGDKS